MNADLVGPFILGFLQLIFLNLDIFIKQRICVLTRNCNVFQIAKYSSKCLRKTDGYLQQIINVTSGRNAMHMIGLNL